MVWPAHVNTRAEGVRRKRRRAMRDRGRGGRACATDCDRPEAGGAAGGRLGGRRWSGPTALAGGARRATSAATGGWAAGSRASGCDGAAVMPEMAGGWEKGAAGVSKRPDAAGEDVGRRAKTGRGRYTCQVGRRRVQSVRSVSAESNHVPRNPQYYFPHFARFLDASEPSPSRSPPLHEVSVLRRSPSQVPLPSPRASPPPLSHRARWSRAYHTGQSGFSTHGPVTSCVFDRTRPTRLLAFSARTHASRHIPPFPPFRFVSVRSWSSFADCLSPAL